MEMCGHPHCVKRPQFWSVWRPFYKAYHLNPRNSRRNHGALWPSALCKKVALLRIMFNPRNSRRTHGALWPSALCKKVALLHTILTHIIVGEIMECYGHPRCVKRSHFCPEGTWRQTSMICHGKGSTGNTKGWNWQSSPR
ncbi:uncharacterized protein MELLADRAFT_105755 [Melampsora larici-populina 98AG31]|uniref:Uncharacterized protein n=1 Tax=Melampsora larici-populina (strain 98AG31 / pathotype 3-4-7) TaxID=747676 RepID=F4RJ80_MELLP|nr:uncharacterized protein MELLADRAFT_105755 [Melampsora larici-populina 98AG31]EGG07272.1 hypothetical protein MELLADRAFT_105755 [Melampsora larici-populina 98AG31]